MACWISTIIPLLWKTLWRWNPEVMEPQCTHNQVLKYSHQLWLTVGNTLWSQEPSCLSEDTWLLTTSYLVQSKWTKWSYCDIMSITINHWTLSPQMTALHWLQIQIDIKDLLQNWGIIPKHGWVHEISGDAPEWLASRWMRKYVPVSRVRGPLSRDKKLKQAIKISVPRSKRNTSFPEKEEEPSCQACK